MLLQNVIDQLGAEAAFERRIPFNETEVLNAAQSYFKKTLGFSEVDVLAAADVSAGKQSVREGVDTAAAELAEPTKPSFAFVNL